MSLLIAPHTARLRTPRATPRATHSRHTLADFNTMAFNETLGECSFPLRRWNLPLSGAPLTLVLDLHSVTEGAPKNKRPAQGQLRIQIGWCRNAPPSRSPPSIAASPELSKFEEAAWLGDPGAQGTASGGMGGVGGGGGGGGGGASAMGLTESKGEAETAEELLEREAAQAAQADKEKARKEHEQRSMAKAPVKGEYQLQVHVLEGRDLVGRDAGGVSDPMVEVSWCGKKQRTATKYKTSTPLWDEHLFLNAENMDEEALNRSQVRVRSAEAA